MSSRALNERIAHLDEQMYAIRVQILAARERRDEAAVLAATIQHGAMWDEVLRLCGQLASLRSHTRAA